MVLRNTELFCTHKTINPIISNGGTDQWLMIIAYIISPQVHPHFL